jgi:hypothetical protein
VNDAEHGVLRFNGASGPVAQLVEQGTFNPKVAGSIPARPIQEAPAKRRVLEYLKSVIHPRLFIDRPAYAASETA